nr:MAG TPA: hypothetical protein [Caudoviricetes sp.]
MPVRCRSVAGGFLARPPDQWKLGRLRFAARPRIHCPARLPDDHLRAGGSSVDLDMSPSFSRCMPGYAKASA